MHSATNTNDPLFVISKIIQSNCGGPIRLKVVGNQTKITGKEPLVKAGYRSMPWESEKGELPVMRMAEVASRVVSIVTQPHRLQMNVPSLGVKFDYTPDTLVMCDSSFCHEVVAGQAFWRSAQKCFLTRLEESAAVPLVLEVKRRSDSSMKDPNYLAKIGLAYRVYAQAGIPFVVLIDFKDIDEEWLPTVNEMTEIKFVECGPLEQMTSVMACGARGWAPFGELSEALGGGKAGREKVFSLHIHRYISVDLTVPLNDLTTVWLTRSATNGCPRV